MPEKQKIGGGLRKSPPIFFFRDIRAGSALPLSGWKGSFSVTLSRLVFLNV
jgi:hypothetical protein